MNVNREGVVILLEDSIGQIAMQLRDDRPDVAYRNCWGLFGGWMEINERAEDAVIREIKEELGCTLDSSRLSFLKSHCGEEPGPWPVTSHIFRYPVSDELNEAVLVEGQAFQFISLADLENRKIVPRHRTILEWYRTLRGESSARL